QRPLCRRAVPRDAVRYWLFLGRPDAGGSAAGRQRLLDLREQILAEFAPLLAPYVWQKQPFGLQFCPETGDTPAHIGGCSEFGDNVEDEWFIVYLLEQITRLFPQLVAKVLDHDGEFLLIEAADHLPKWLNPETSENRVFFCEGRLHIIPCPTRPAEVGWPREKTLTISQALTLLSCQRDACLASTKIQSALRRRLEGYPGKIQANLHHAHCFLPAGIVTVLSQRPDLLAPAVSAFYLRDPVDLQACRTFRFFPPETRVIASVTFTRCLYAQLQQQSFAPDRRSGFTLPARSHPQHRAHELGMKLAHGFEILCSNCQEASSEPDAPVSCNPQWKSFLGSLKKNGYFRGELEGSQLYKELMLSAQSFFRQSASSIEKSPGAEVLQILHDSPYNLDELKKQEKCLAPEDSDSWLDLTPQDLDQLLQERAGVGFGMAGSSPSQAVETGKNEGEVEAASYTLVAVTQKMKNFINAVSSHEGAELPWSVSSDPFSFDPDAVTSALDRLLGARDDELDSDDLEDDDDDYTEEDDDVEEENEAVGFSGSPREAGAQALGTLKMYMDQMDQELSATNIGQSFTQSKKVNSSKVQPSNDQVEVDEIQPLDVDLNLVTNLLESLSSQAGLAGPASNLLQSMGVHLPSNLDRP
uniref:Ecdysoneless n=1 Tax=Denticeps clupeoides TaxID=299321 RepID=A0AAY4C871_9TELE